MINKIIILNIFILFCIFNKNIQAKEKFFPFFIEGKITKIHDGDTLQITTFNKFKIKIRLYGIDSPEISRKNINKNQQQKFGIEAKNFLIIKIWNNFVKIKIINIDHYKRYIGIILYNEKNNINLELIKNGLAWTYKKYLKLPFDYQYIYFEKKAYFNNIGLWQDPYVEAPWEFRKKYKK